MTAAHRYRGLPIMLLIVVVIAGCGANSLSAGQLRTRATRICTLAQRRTARIATPALPSQGARFLGGGVAALAPELTALRRLRAPTDLAAHYRTALTATAQELAALRSSLKGLKAGNDPVVAIKTLQTQLTPLEARAAGAWGALDLPACQGH
ncbi:MAG: hypothetical protein ACR2NR_18590 [Solirubrobacteraceae bacterium]